METNTERAGEDNTALLFIVIIGGIVGVGLLISRQ